MSNIPAGACVAFVIQNRQVRREGGRGREGGRERERERGSE